MKEKKLNYITVLYNCLDETAEYLYKKFDVIENKGNFYSINVLKVPEFFINFRIYYKPKYKKIIYINFQNIRLIYDINWFNDWQKVVSMFDEIYECFEFNVREYRPEIQNKVKLLNIQLPKEIQEFYYKNFGPGRFCENIYKQYDIGDHTTMQNNQHFPTTCPDKICIGRYTSIGERTEFVLNRDHPYSNVSQCMLKNKFVYNDSAAAKFVRSKGNIIVGNDVWFGMDSRIMSNVNIGDGAVVATGAIVTKDVPPYAIVGGNPAKIIKYRFTKKQIKKLLKIKWWDWPVWKVYDNIDLIDSPNIDEFIKKFYKR